jgi:limonene 1,2-monooxygenase
VSEGGASGGGSSVVGTPDDLIDAIQRLQATTGGFGVVLGFAHDWANREATMRSWEMVARYVIPALNGQLRPLQASADYVSLHQAELMAGASKAIMSKIMSHEGAAKALSTTMEQMAAQRAQGKGDGRSNTFRPSAGIPDAEPAEA